MSIIYRLRDITIQTPFVVPLFSKQQQNTALQLRLKKVGNPHLCSLTGV